VKFVVVEEVDPTSAVVAAAKDIRKGVVPRQQA
jgi:hypothetical protein